MQLLLYTRSADPTRLPGGITTYTTVLAGELAALGHDCHIITEHIPVTPIANVTYHEVSVRWFGPLERLLPGVCRAISVSRAANRIAAQYGIQIVEFPNWDYPGLFFKKKCPMVVRLHTGIAQSPYDQSKQTFFERIMCSKMERHAILKADALISSTRAHAESMERCLGIRGDKIQYIPLGLPDDPRPCAKTPRPRNNPPIILYVGRMEPRKGSIDLIHAFPLVKGAIPNAKLVMIGKDTPRAPGNMRHAEYARGFLPPIMAADLVFPGEIDNTAMYNWHCKADVFTAPSLYESFGLVFVEAMKRTLPIIATNAGGIPEVIENGTDGILVDPGQPDQLARAIIHMLSNESDRMEYATNARKRFERDFSSVKMAKNTAAFYEAIIASHK